MSIPDKNQKPLSIEPEKKPDEREDDRLKRGYYYDDAHGYELYDPGDLEDEDCGENRETP